MDLFKKNLESLPELADIYEKLSDKTYQVETTKNNLYTIKLNNVYLHSKYDPKKEAEKISDILLTETDDLDIIIIFGWGLGYVVKELYERLLKSTEKKIKPYLIVIENDINVFFTSIKHLDYSDILNDPNLRIFLSAEKEMIGGFIQSVPTKKVRYYNHRPSYVIHQDYYKEIQGYIGYVLNRKDMNNATFKRFQKLWMNNIINNLPYYLESNHLNRLRDTASGMTSIVIAGGPGLDECISHLKEWKEFSVVIAVDTVCSKLIENGIIPDIIATIDPQYWNYKFLENVKITSSIVVTDASVYYKVFQLTEPRRYFSGNSIFPLTKYFDGSDRGTLGAGGSVATIAFDTARIIGSGRIILLGLDLSFPDRKTHFHGAYFENNFLSISNYFFPAETHSYRYLACVGLELIESTRGKVYSDARMILFKKWFDREIQLTSSKVILPDLGGARIDGATISTLADIDIQNNGDKNNFKIKIENIINKPNALNSDSLIRMIDEFLAKSNELKYHFQKIITHISDEGVVETRHIDFINNCETSIQSDVKLFEVMKVISSSSQDMIITIMENFKFNENEKQSGWIKTKMLYKSMAESID